MKIRNQYSVNLKSQISNLKFEQGFTITELVIAVVVIIVLGIISFTLFQAFTNRARDAKKKADVEAIATAYETNYDSDNEVFRALKEGRCRISPTPGARCPDDQFETGDFGSEKIPQPPEGGDYQGVVRCDPSGSCGTPFPSFNVCATLSNNSKYCRVPRQKYQITPTPGN